MRPSALVEKCKTLPQEKGEPKSMMCRSPIPIIINLNKTKGKENRHVFYKQKLTLGEVKDVLDEDILYVPCRRCPNCKDKIIKEWSNRLKHEYETNQFTGYFVTLTYDTPYLPEKGANIEDVQKYIKRLRKNIQKKQKRKISYFISSEYGEEDGRIHYHAILIGLERQNKELIDTSWNRGFTSIKVITYGRILYTLEYMFKDQIVPEGMNQPFTLKSKGIGNKWWEKNLDEILNDKAITINNKQQTIPRYYIKKIREKYPEFYEYLTEPPEKIKNFLNGQDIETKDMTLGDIKKHMEDNYSDPERYKYILAHNKKIENKKLFLK